MSNIKDAFSEPNDPAANTTLMARDPDLKVGSTPKRVVERKMSEMSRNYDVGNKGHLTAAEKLMREADINNDGTLDTEEVRNIVTRLLSIDAQRSFFKKMVIVAGFLLLLSFVGNFGMMWTVLALTRQTAVDGGGLVDVHTGNMVNTQARGLTLLPDVLSTDERRLNDMGDKVVRVASLPLDNPAMTKLFLSVVEGGTVNYLFKNDGVAYSGRLSDDMTSKTSGVCTDYSASGSPPYNIPFNVQCCGKDDCEVNCDCEDLSNVQLVKHGRKLESPLEESTGHKACSGHSGYLAGADFLRQLLSEVDLVSELQLRGDEACMDEHFQLAVHALQSHLVVLAVPQEGSTCPMIMADAGYTKAASTMPYAQVVVNEEGAPVLSKHLTVIEPYSVQDLESLLYFGTTMSLQSFHHAIQSARTLPSEESSLHGVVGYCPTFILDVLVDLRVDFGKKALRKASLDFVVQALMKAENRRTIVADIQDKIQNPAIKAWLRVRGDKYALKRHVKTYLKKYYID